MKNDTKNDGTCHTFSAQTNRLQFFELFATTRTKTRGRKGLVSVDSHFASRLSSMDESRLPIQHHDSMGRVTLFRCEHRGCNFKRTFCNQADEKNCLFFGRTPSPLPQKTAFVKGRWPFADPAPRFNATCHTFSVRTQRLQFFFELFLNG